MGEGARKRPGVGRGLLGGPPGSWAGHRGGLGAGFALKATMTQQHLKQGPSDGCFTSFSPPTLWRGDLGVRVGGEARRWPGIADSRRRVPRPRLATHRWQVLHSLAGRPAPRRL